jgi:hypothetical protein
MGHIWNVIPDESGKMIPCDRETDMGTWKIDERIDLPKAYRYVWATDSERETTVKNAKNFVPELFRKNLRDVTAEYVPVSNITTKAKSDLSYLCVFDNVNWKPIAMAKKHWSKAVFRDMGRKTVYLPARYKGDELFSSSFPLLLDSAGLTHTLEPDLKNKQTMLLTRKFHSRRIGFYYNRMINGKFQGANHADFNDATNLYEITEIPPLSFSTIELPEKKEFRYFRYIGAKGSFCNVAEITVHYDNGEKMTGKVIGTQSSSDFFDRGKEKESAFDGDGLTYFKSATDSGGWVGLDFGQPQSIAKIRFMPRNDDNNIRNGDEYELFYWSKTGWQSLGVQTGTESGELIYDNCPTNALFWLRNHTRGKEERIFTYENGKQVFW